MKRRVGILGGTFNPPHIGHLIIANEVLCALDLDEVRFMPNHEPPHKQKAGNVTAEDRLAMVSLAIADHPKFTIEDIELLRKGKSYTYDTMVLLKEREPDTEFYFIIGGDMIEFLPHWYRIEELCKMVHFVGVKRPNYCVDTPYPVQMVDVPEIQLSSSLIRKKIAEHQTVKYLLPDRVISYIKENRLYEP